MSRTLRSLALELSARHRDEHAKACVLVVEARNEVREEMARELGRLGCTSLEARTPLETIHILEWAHALVHAVAIGPSLTQTRAEELASFLAEAYPDLPVVIVEDVHSSVARDLENGLVSVAQRIRDSCGGLPQVPVAG